MMNHKLILKISTVLLIGMITVVIGLIETATSSAPYITVAQKQDTCDNFKVLSPIGQVDVDVATYFSWTAVEEADEYVLVIVDDKGNVAHEVYVGGDQTWIYYTLKPIQINTKLNYKIYAQKKDGILCSTRLEPVDPWIAQLTGTPIPPTPTPYLMRNDNGQIYTLHTLTPTPTLYFTQN